MRALVVGGGPGGLFFALLAKRARPELELHVVEQNPRDATYGFAVVFTPSALAALRPAAPEVIDEIAAHTPPVEHMELLVRDERRSIHGHAYHRIGRVDLLALLQRHARAAGVTLAFEQRVSAAEQLDGWDLVVGADGVNSVVRELHAEAFGAAVAHGRNWFAWYGATRAFDAVSLIFEPQPEGLFIGHAYAYEPARSGFVVELAPETFAKAGFAEAPDAAARARCEQAFARQLDGAELLDNRSQWFRPKFVSCERWVAGGNVTLLGDALHTVHPSIGSGTRFAMRDAAALAHALAEAGDDVGAALGRYEGSRRRRADAFQRAARRSIAWYEGLAERDPGDPTQLALAYVMRTGRVRYEDFRRANPELIADYERPGRRGGAPAPTTTEEAVR